MDSLFNAKYDVNVLASAFNMDKATFSGKLKLIDDWTSFDNDRFSAIIENSDMMELVTDEELELMKGVKAVLVDEEWFQVYDNHIGMTETQVASGMYWNYFYNTWKTVSSSPFSNAIVFVSDTADIELPSTLTFTVGDKVTSEVASILTLKSTDSVALIGGNVVFTQTEEATTNGVAVHEYGAIIIPNDCAEELTLELEVNGVKYEAGSTITVDTDVETQIVFNKQ